jgi:hypothetical protein
LFHSPVAVLTLLFVDLLATIAVLIVIVVSTTCQNGQEDCKTHGVCAQPGITLSEASVLLHLRLMAVLSGIDFNASITTPALVASVVDNDIVMASTNNKIVFVGFGSGLTTPTQGSWYVHTLLCLHPRQTGNIT